MTTRNGDAYHYNAQGKLKEIVTSGGDRFEYSYDHSGNRIKKTLKNLNTTTYSFGSLYEVYRAPGKPEKHTMFVLGVEGDIVAQYSRGDASLVTSMASNDWLVNPFCKDVTIDCGTYWKNRIGLNFITFLAETNVYVAGKLKEGHRAIPWVLILGTLFVIVHLTRNMNLENTESNLDTGNLFGITLIPNLSNYIHKQFPRYVTSTFLVIFTFTSTGEGESGTPVWLLGIGSGVPANTPSVSNESSSGGGGSASSGSARIAGMFFYHPDHLGSITMITDGNGNVLAGGERGGKSHITYKPYGEILRTDSYGPDITKFKYTGQEEDRESGLYYYKSRYYDSSLGRFISNDGMVFPKKTQGMNRQMYVEGNPMMWRDVSGNKISTSLSWAIMGAMGALNAGLSPEMGFAAGAEFGRGRERQARGRRFEHRAKFVKVKVEMPTAEQILNTARVVLAKTSPALLAALEIGKASNEGRLDKRRKGRRNERRDYVYNTITAISCGPGGPLGGPYSSICVPILNTYIDKYGDLFLEGAYTNAVLTVATTVPCGTGVDVSAQTPQTDRGISPQFSWSLFVNNILRLVNGFDAAGQKKENCISNI